MRIVVDTNILFSLFWEKSFTKEILSMTNFELISSEVALEELKKYSSLIISKTKINKPRFEKTLFNLRGIVTFLRKKEYSEFIQEAKKISPDPNDADFLAVCLKLKCPLWSNDKILKNQEKVHVLSTKDIVEMIFGG